MRALLSALLGLAAWTLASCAPTERATGEPAMWRIADADSEIWLLGSVHLLPADINWRGPRLNAAFAAADEFVTETDLPNAETAAAFQAFAERHGRLPAGQTLSQRIGPREAERLAGAARALGIEPAAFEQQRPWLTALQLASADLIRSGLSPDLGVEAVLGAEAIRTGKRLSSFETLEQQLSVLADLAPADEERFLAVTLDEIGASDELVAQVDRAWARGDVALMERQFRLEWREAGPGMHEAIILNRNRAWADAIERRLAGSGRTFVAVGAAHLIGEGSVVDLLRSRGIAVDGP